MTTATVGALRVVLGLDSATFTDGLKAAQKHLQGVGRQMQAFGESMMGVGTGLSAAITAPLIGLGAIAVNEASEMRDAVGQVNAALTSMGDAGGRSIDQLTESADRLAGTSLFEDDQILRGVTANLLTFGNISGEAFDRAQQAAVDLATRLQMDLQPATLLVGKALNDPIKGLSALSRAGIQFTEDQRALIKSMVEAGDTAGAQAIMLSELERQFGGSGQAARDAANPMERIRLSFAAMAGDIGTVLLPIADRLASWFAGMAQAFGNLSPQMQQVVVVVAALAAALGPVLVVVGAVVSAVGALLPVFAAVGAPILAVVAAVAAVAVAFYVFRDQLIPVVEAFATAIRENVGPRLAPIWEALKGAVAAVGEIFAIIFGKGGEGGEASGAVKFFAEVVGRAFGAVAEYIRTALEIATNILKALGAALRGDFSAMWGYLAQAAGAAAQGVVRVFEALFPEVVAWVRRTYEGVKEWLLDRFEAVVRGIGEKVARVTGFFKDMWDAVVGNSWVPDMVIAIADWMGPRLKAAMVDPAQAAISQTTDAFEDMSRTVDGQMESLFQSLSNKDWKGALGSIFEMMGNAGGGMGAWGRIGSAVLGALPGFKTGGSFTVGGSGGLDSQTVAFRATPGEMVDIRKPGQMDAGGAMALTVNPSPYFDVVVERVSAGPASRAGMQAYSASRKAVATDQAKAARYTLGRTK